MTTCKHKPLVAVPDGLDSTERCRCGAWRIVGWTNRFGREESAWQPADGGPR